jgi:hypothetical protein
MKPLLRLDWLALLAWLIGLGQAQMVAATEVPWPEDFGLRRQGDRVAVSWARIEATMPRGVDKPAIEALCKRLRDQGQPVGTPQFEPGWDQPGRIESHRWVSATLWANLSIHHGYGCMGKDGQQPVRPEPCGCTYGPLSNRYAQIKRYQQGRLESTKVDFARRTGQRLIQPAVGKPFTFADADASLAAWAPTITGQERWLEMQCQVRRKDLPNGGWMEWCVTARDDVQLQPPLRGVVLRSATYGPEGPAGQSISSRLVRVVLDAEVDSGVFSDPQGIAYKP